MYRSRLLRATLDKINLTFFHSCSSVLRVLSSAETIAESEETRSDRESPAGLISQTNAADWILACCKMDRSLWITDYRPSLPSISLRVVSYTFVRRVLFLRFVLLAGHLATSSFAEAPPPPWSVPFQQAARQFATCLRSCDPLFLSLSFSYSFVTDISNLAPTTTELSGIKMSRN